MSDYEKIIIEQEQRSVDLAETPNRNAGSEENEVAILEVKKLPKQNWLRIDMELTLQWKHDHIDQLPNLIDLLGGTHLSVFVESRKPRCHICGSVTH
ncbi:Hypothetical predicted protein [Octopus vulgaris]|uniref:Uncharacterized protein n=1 Tax=Octopus vulgaris TaxID=6645 RepID=A0AA36ATS2_OCTVU|nr:Hypothetical predicted protein [Octopus vulgaris]